MKVIRSSASALAIGGVLLGTAMGLAGTAAADATPGTYTATVIDGGQFVKPGAQRNAVLSGCGDGCMHIQMAVANTDLRFDGNTWTGTYGADKSFGPCTITLDNATLNVTDSCPAFDMNILYSMAPKG